jgi:hypothetical protein
MKHMDQGEAILAYVWPRWTDFWITVVAAVFITTFSKCFEAWAYPRLYEIQRETDETLRIKKATKNVQNLFKGVWFTITVIWGTYILRKSDYLPWYLLGKGDITNMYKSHPFNEYPPGMKYYYLGTLGYYVGKTFEDMFMREKRNDFVEMLLHHILTIELYVGSYMTNHLAIGSLVILTLDWTSICVGFSRGLSETKYKAWTIGFGVGMFLTWIYFRIIVYPVVYY